ncbi:MAG TPA: hypothetical protein VLB44_04185, partial [Kofleriaceae bacterium]|nr:hypothetical protein [Kofleriaceae bacterium]
EERGLGTEAITDPELAMRLQAEHDDPVARVHAGVRMGVGSALRGPLDHSVLAGVYAEVRIAPRLAFVGRLDWTQRGGEMTSQSAAAVSTGIAFPVLDLKAAVITFGAAHRTELRLGKHSGWDTLGLAGDLALEVIPKNLPGSLGLRFEQGVSDHGQATALLLELGVGN